MDHEDRSRQSDVEVMRQVQTGQPERFAELIRRYQEPLARVAYSRLGRRDWAEEVVQETFLAAFKSRRTFDPRFSFRTWLWTILFRQCHGHWKSRQRQPYVWSWADTDLPQASVGPDGYAPESRDPAPSLRLLADERREQLERHLGELRPTQADALRLRFYGELKFQEIADTMGCSLLTAKNRVRAGLLQLAKLLDAPALSEPPDSTSLSPTDAAATGPDARGAL